MSLFVISDTHLSLSADKSMTVFRGWDDYVTRLEKKWRALVKPTDTVVIAGDVSWAMALEETLADFSFLNDLPGQKLLFKGNHDYWWCTRRKMDAFLKENGLHTLRIVHNDAVAVDNRFAVCGSRGWYVAPSEEDNAKIIQREAARLKTSIDAAKKTGLEPVVFLHYPPIADGIVCKIGIMAKIPENKTPCDRFIAISRTEYADFVEQTIRL
ncbi:MAG: metallophosphoesterase, partial [Clostridia bacterium]|nr:metallophosphoesterase [Clostridia bacterium]